MKQMKIKNGKNLKVTCVSDSEDEVMKFEPNKVLLTASRIVLSKILNKIERFNIKCGDQ